ncbi:dienelactone hydrolase [Naematelia encephala]|uniref:Dienelactone hydrolase n=1 Tax=Naematelia encephala TaxID=71784 RepID=A0A1Y2BJQ6_9TREE|nr:dienelactone hydrolase [Naematelia encephala]
MSFLPIQPCCLKRQELPGTPTGVFEPPNEKHKVGRYIAKPPQDSSPVKPATAVVLFYDAMGFGEPNPKILADTLAAKLNLPVFVPDYIPNPPKSHDFDAVMASTPNEYANRAWYKTFWEYMKLIFKIVPYIPSIKDGRVVPLCNTAVAEIKAEGYTNLGAIGYCRGGSMVMELLSKGDRSPLKCGVICHPSPSVPWTEKITLPSSWHLASHDIRFKDPEIAKLRQIMEAKKGVEFSCTVYPDTVHGFAARPNQSSESAVKAFEETHEAAVEFFNKHLVD